jgi:hydrogenase expression/formation protein HypC
MCLAVPGKLVDTFVEHDVRMGRVDFGGMVKRVCLEHLSDAVPGDYVLVHVGFALARIDEDEAMRTLELLRELGEFAEVEAEAEAEGELS